jgi:hypothetical protein
VNLEKIARVIPTALSDDLSPDLDSKEPNKESDCNMNVGGKHHIS